MTLDPAVHRRISTPRCASLLPPYRRADGCLAGRRLGWPAASPGSVLQRPRSALHALRLLSAHGQCDAALQTVYRTIVLARLMYTASLVGIHHDLRPGSASKDFYSAVCKPVTAVQTSWRPPSWSKTRMTSCFTRFSTAAATLYSHRYPIIIPTHTLAWTETTYS